MQSFQHLITEAKVDFGKTSEDYAKYRPGLPSSFFERINSSFVRLQGNMKCEISC